MRLEHLLKDLRVVAAANAGLLQKADLAASGLSARDIDRLLSSGSLTRIHRDVYMPAGVSQGRTRFAAAAVAIHRREPGAILAGPAAVSILGLPLFGTPRTVHVTGRRRGGTSSRSLVTAVATPPEEQISRIDGRPVVGAARAALDTARLHSLVAGVVASDAALASGMATEDELDRVLQTMSGLHGVERARLCRSLSSRLSESPGESWSAVVMHQHRIPVAQRQHGVVDDEGFVGRVDFWWPGSRTVGEFDGRVKYGRLNITGRPPEDILWEEKRREDRLRGADLRVVRWTVLDLRTPAPWLRRLRAQLAV